MVCSTHGLCNRAGECDCPVWWRGTACGTPYCNSSICVNGACAAAPGAGDGRVCVCEPGWTGLGCVSAVCASGCSAAHGYCAAPGACTCAVDWGGPLCTVAEGSGALHELGLWLGTNRTPCFIALGSLGLAWVWTHAWVSNVLQRRPGAAPHEAERRRRAAGAPSKRVHFAPVLTDVAPPCTYSDESSGGEMSAASGGRSAGGGGAARARGSVGASAAVSIPHGEGGSGGAPAHERVPSPPPPTSESPVPDGLATAV